MIIVEFKSKVNVEWTGNAFKRHKQFNTKLYHLKKGISKKKQNRKEIQVYKVVGTFSMLLLKLLIFVY